MRLSSTDLTITNPGGLFGIHNATGAACLDISSERCTGSVLNQYTYSRRDRVIEALASGIPTVLAEMRSAGMPEPDFFDQGIAFTVKLQPKVLDASRSPSPQATTARSLMPSAASLKHSRLHSQHETSQLF